MVACGQWRWLWVVDGSGGGWGFGFAYCSSESSMIGLWCFFGSSMYYFIGVDILFYCSGYIILLC